MRGFIGAIFPWRYRARALPGPGMENLAFETLALPQQTPIGPAMRNYNQLSTQGSLSFQNKLIGVDGLGGLQSGQFVGTPLFVPPQGGFQG